MVQENHMQVHFDAKSVNEGLARMVVTAFMTNMNPTLEQIADVKTAVSEAVTNAIIHGYENLSGYTKHGEMRPAYSIIHPGKVRLHCILENDTLSIEVSDQGKGIEDVARAMENGRMTVVEDAKGGGYEDETKQAELTCDQNGQQLVVTVEDHGVGIEDLEQALQPFFTTKPELERSGMGFSFMEAFMDRIEVRSKKGEGTRVVMWKYIEREREQ